MKKHMSFLLTAALVLAVASCGPAETTGSTEKPTASVTTAATVGSETAEGTTAAVSEAAEGTTVPETTETTTGADTETAASVETTEKKVWIPRNGGTKYHSRRDCSGMKDPRYVKLYDARMAGYSPCKRCN